MSHVSVAPYGSWSSPITAASIAAGTVELGQIALDGADVYWIEGRPTEGGRSVVVRRAADGTVEDATPAPFNARTRVHEYGGGAFAVDAGTLFFANFADQRLYRRDPGGEPRPITPEAALRYADFVVDRPRARLVAVREDHTEAGTEAVNTLVAVASDGDAAGGRVLVAGHDFYATPRLSPDGQRLAWLAWNHPNMPWDGTELWLGHLAADGTVASSERIAGGGDESIFQPEWSPDGVLHFVSDRTGWWNLYRWRAGEPEPLCPMAAEFGGPHWTFGVTTYAFAADDCIVCTYLDRGVSHLALVNPETRAFVPIETDYSALEGPRATPDQVVLRAGSATTPEGIVRFDLATGEARVLRRSSADDLDPGYLSSPRAIEFPTEGGLTAFGFFYPPANPAFAAPPTERPPLLVQSHGGPTGSTSTLLDLGVQYWTSRGFAVLDVDYGGSTGYGREYRRRLDDRWGIVDVDDCVNGARFLVGAGLVDPDRLVVRGWSASGYTTLAALTFRDFFKAGASHFGISDLETMTRDTHKFESRYLDRLVGPYPDRRDRYVERSPIHFTDRLAVPLILFQGLEDKVVPPDQAELMYEAVRAKGRPVAYVPFAGEQHGFRRAENIARALDAERFFYARVFDFDLPDPIQPVPIANL